MRSPAGLHESVQTRKAERAGFEPAVRFDPDTSLAMMRIRPLCHLSGSYDQAAEYSFTTDERNPRQRLVSRAENDFRTLIQQNRNSCYDVAFKSDSVRGITELEQRPRGSCPPRYRARGGRNFGPNVVLGMSRGQMLARPMLRHPAGSLLFRARMSRSGDEVSTLSQVSSDPRCPAQNCR